MRLRTTGKDVNTPQIQALAREFRDTMAPVFATHPHALLFNMDETPVYLDAPGNRTIDRIGAKTVEIGTTHHEKQRVTAVLCVSCAGTKVDALVVHRCHETTRLKKTNQLVLKQIPLPDGDGSARLWNSHCPSAYMNSDIMCKWLERIYTPHSTAHSQPHHDSVLLMDTMGAHDSPMVKEEMERLGVRAEFFPPNCTPVLQPLDHSVNASFKREYEAQWAVWYQQTAGTKLTAKGNKQKATESDVNSWVAAALHRITAEHVRRAWQHTLLGRPFPLLMLQESVFHFIVSYLRAPPQSLGAAVALLIAHYQRKEWTRRATPVQLSRKRPRAEDAGEAEGQRNRSSNKRQRSS